MFSPALTLDPTARANDSYDADFGPKIPLRNLHRRAGASLKRHVGLFSRAERPGHHSSVSICLSTRVTPAGARRDYLVNRPRWRNSFGFAQARRVVLKPR